MSIKIHHGPPGSYKTSGAIQDDLIPAIRSGRVVVTNIRGIKSRDEIIEILGGEVPDTFEVFSIPTYDHSDAVRNREFWSRFWHTVPLGAFIFIDEAQDIFKKSWRDSDLAKLDYPGGRDAALADKRPFDFKMAFDMHRHYNWDMVLTTPKISKLRDDIRGAAEGAYKHKNMALNGLPGRYLEGFHHADDNGHASELMGLQSKKIKPFVFDLYESTSTGTVSDTLAGSPLWKNPKILGLLSLLVLLFGFLLTRPVPAIFGGSGPAPPSLVAAVPVVSPPVPPVPGVVAAAPAGPPVPGPVASPGNPGAGAGPGPLDAYRFRVVSELLIPGDRIVRFRAYSPGDTGEYFHYYERDLIQLGYEVRRFGFCRYAIAYRGGPPRLVGCPRHDAPDSSAEVVAMGQGASQPLPTAGPRP